MTTVGAALPFRPRGPLARRAALPGRAGLLAAVRLLVWAALWGTVLRNIGASVGVWAAGSLGAGLTILIGIVLPAWLFVVFPSWLAFRIAAPRGMRRLAVVACWMSPLVRMRDLASIGAFFDVAIDSHWSPSSPSSRSRPSPAWGELPIDAWTALAAAVQADRRRSLSAAARIVDALAHLPGGARFPSLARVHGVETLVESAASRGDWAAAARYARIGHGRLIRLFALVAAGVGGDAVPARVLWTRWLLAPRRRTTWPLVRALARRRGAASVARRAPAALASVHARHVALLGAAARNEDVRADEVLALAAAWQAELDDAALARLQARALELGVRDGATRARALCEQVQGELVQLLSRADGEVPRTHAKAPGETLVSRAREQQLARIKAALAALDADRAGPSPHPLEAWQRWLTLRAAWERAEQTAARPALAALWRASVRDGLWSYCCALSHQHGARAGWAVFVMFDWLADRAEYVGDLVAVLANRENARIALAGLR